MIQIFMRKDFRGLALSTKYFIIEYVQIMVMYDWVWPRGMNYKIFLPCCFGLFYFAWQLYVGSVHRNKTQFLLLKGCQCYNTNHIIIA